MTGRMLEFRSIRICEVEKIHPLSGDTVTVLEMDENSIEKHKLQITLTDIIRNSTWLINFFLSIMITAAYAGIVFTAFLIFAKSSNSGSLPLEHRIIVILSSAVLFLGLWIFF